MKCIFKLIPLLLIFCFEGIAGFSQEKLNQPKKFSENELKEDVIFLKKALKEAHPSLY